MQKRSFGLGDFAIASASLLAVPAANAVVIQGNVYYTINTGGTNDVSKVGYSYDEATQTLTYSAQTGVATVAGADGVMFAPNGNILVTSNSQASVYRIDASTGATLQTVSTNIGLPNYHMALDPSGTRFYSSNTYNQVNGSLGTFAINSNGSISSAVLTPINSVTGALSNVTQLAFAPNGKVLYTNGAPNGNGSIGVFTFGASTDTTQQLIAANTVQAAHGIVYDPYTGLMTMFGGVTTGQVATLDPTAANIAGSLKATGANEFPTILNFDQGSVDGLGHAFIAGSNSLTFIDYSATHDITSPLDKVITISGFNGIDDVAPLAGAGAPPPPPPPGIPEPATPALVLAGLAAAAMTAKKRRSR